jgi:hypothetical protein
MSGTTKDAVERLSPYAIDGGRDAYGAMEADTFGDYVAWEDYLALAAERDAARAEVARLQEALAAIRDAHPTGLSWSLMNDGTWRDACRDFQRIARAALKQEADHDKD